jgi:hypothetical protein
MCFLLSKSSYGSPPHSANKKKQKDSRHKHSPGAQKPSFMRLLLLVFLSALLIQLLSFFSFFLLEIIIKKKTTMKNANDNFGSSNGSENFYCHKPSLMLYTDGVKELAESSSAYWLIDLIISHQCHREINLERFQVWDLKRVKDNVFTILATDGNHNKVTSQEIPFSDFPYDMATIWLVDGCMMLPCEY